MSSKLILENENGKELVINSGSALEDKQIQASDMAYTRTTIEDMMAIPSPSDNEVCVVTEEGRGGTFIYDSTQSTINNGGIIFNGWKRQYGEAVNVNWFGAKGDGSTDDTIAIQTAINYVANNVDAIKYIGSQNGIKNILTGNGVYSISLTLNIINISGLKIKNMKVKALDSFTGDYLINIDNTFSTLSENCKIINCIFDSNHKCGGIKISNQLRFLITDSYFVHYTDKCGIYSSNEIHELFVSKNWFGEYIWGEDGYDKDTSKIGTAIRILYDTSILDNVIFYSNIGIKIDGKANTLKGNHIYVGRTKHALEINSPESIITANYFDNSIVYFSYTPYSMTLSNNFWLYGGFDKNGVNTFIEIDIDLNSWLKWNFVGNTFIEDTTNSEQPEIYTTTGSGNITRWYGNCYNTYASKKIFFKTTKHGYIASADSIDIDFSDLLPEGSVIQAAIASVRPNDATITVKQNISFPSDQVVRVTIDSSTNFTAYVVVDIRIS